MPRRRKQTSAADYAYVALLIAFLFVLLTGGIYLIAKLLWEPVKRLDRRNPRIPFAVIAIGMILGAILLLGYQGVTAPDGTPASARFSTNALGFAGSSALAYVLSLFVVFDYEARRRRSLDTDIKTALLVTSANSVTSQASVKLPAGLLGTVPLTRITNPRKERPMVTHEIWKPSISGGIAGQKIAIIGYSHYLEADSEDPEDLSIATISAVITGEQKQPFFTSVRNYFGFDNHAEFWSKVYFLNFLPEAVGGPEAKYANGSEELIQRAQRRFMRFLEDEKSDKVFIFSKKGWEDFPEETIEEKSGGKCTPLVSGQTLPNWGTYAVGDKHILTCGFRHTQGANAEEMTSHVQKFLRMAPAAAPLTT